MTIISLWNQVVRTGLDDSQSDQFKEKLRNRNCLSLLCVIFSCFYVGFFSVKGLYLPFAAITVGIILFSLSIYFNFLKRYFLSSMLVLVNTNYCVLFFSLYLGFDSGIHLYLFTSPLIVLSLFFPGNSRFIYLAMLTYIVNFFVILVAGKHFSIQLLSLTQDESHLLYVLNFIFAILIVISLSLYLLHSSEKINFLIYKKNKSLNKEIASRINAEKTAAAALKDREILLAEIHHRVNNNLAIVSGFLNMQLEKIKDDESKLVFDKARERIYSMAQVHNQLYTSKSFGSIEFSQYIHDFSVYCRRNFNLPPSIVIIEKTERVFLNLSTSIPCALILNELLRNAFTHAFKYSGSGVVEIGLRAEGEMINLWVADTGCGMCSEKVNENSIGMNILHALVEQLDGSLVFENCGGSKFSIRFRSKIVSNNS